MEIKNAITMLAVAKRIAERNNTTPSRVIAMFNAAVNKPKLSARDFLLPRSDISLAGEKSFGASASSRLPHETRAQECAEGGGRTDARRVCANKRRVGTPRPTVRTNTRR